VLLVAIAAMLVVAVAMVFWWKRDDSATTPGPIAAVSIAVLPFVAMGEEENLRHLGEGIAEEFTNQFAGQPNLEVASRTSAFQSHEGMDAVAIARALDVAYVLEGSVRPSGDLIRLTTQLIRAADGIHLWSESYDLQAQGAATEQDKTIRAASLMVMAQMELDRFLRNARLETTNEEAFQSFAAAARARGLMNRGGTTETWHSVIAKVDKALALDPDFAPAHGLRINGYLNRAGNTVRWDVAAREARKSIDRASARHPKFPGLIQDLAGVQMILELDYTAAQQTLERLRTIDPDWAPLSEASAMLAMRRGRVRDAMRYWQQAIERDPLNYFPRASYASMLYLRGDLAGAERNFDEAERLAPQGASKLGATAGRILISIQRGDLEKAKTEFEPLWSEYQYTATGDLGFLLARLGHEAEARALVAELSLDAKADPVTIFWLYYGLKDYEHALEWMRRGIDDRNAGFLSFVRLPNAFPEIQDLPGFAAVLGHLDSLQRSP
jgi:TolB-like protein